MKNFLYVFILMSSLPGCSSSASQNLSPEKLQGLERRDAIILNSLHEEPQRQGKKEVLTEDGIRTEIWRMRVGHGDATENVETLIYKMGELISHSYVDGQSGLVGSKQFRHGKVIQYTEEVKGKTTVIYFDENENIKGRLSYNGDQSECILYDNSKPRLEKMQICEAKFNNAP